MLFNADEPAKIGISRAINSTEPRQQGARLQSEESVHCEALLNGKYYHWPQTDTVSPQTIPRTLCKPFFSFIQLFWLAAHSSLPTFNTSPSSISSFFSQRS
ncbi:uncharacterized [Tachysurus ichikawai]